MDSPPDLSPNAPPSDHFGLQGRDIVTSQPDAGGASSNDSVDSFEKVDAHSDLLADYSTNFHNQMQQSLYGQLPEDPFARSINSSSGGVDLLGDTVDDERLPEPDDMDSVIEHNYDDVGDRVGDLIDKLAEHEGAQAVARAVEEVPRAAEDLLQKTDESWETAAKHAPSHSEYPAHVPEPYQEPHHHHHHYEEPPKEPLLDFAEPVPEPYQKPHNLLDETHKHLDDLLGHQHVEPVHTTESPLEESGRDTISKLISERSDDDIVSSARRSVTPEETTFDRTGPLTIPSHHEPEPEPEPAPAIPHTYDEVPHHHDAHHHHGFDTVPRPPTPPKELSEEDVKPTTVHLGHHDHHHHHDAHHRSILKHSSSGKGPWVDFKTVDPRVLDLIYWRDPKKSGIALAAILAVLFVFARFPIITVLSYSGLAALTATVGFRVAKAVEAQIKKTDAANPFQPYLEQDLTVPQDRVHEQVDVLVEHGQCLARQLRRLFLVENIVDSVKFGLLLWSFTYIGAWFSGITLAFLTVIAIFSVPKIYETYQEPIDTQIGVIKGHIDNVTNIVEEKLPFLRRPVAAVEKKDQ